MTIARNMMIALVSAAAFALAGCGADAPSETPVETASAEPLGGYWTHEISDLAPDPIVRYGRLDNGLRYGIVANDTPSGEAYLRLQFNVGSLNENDAQQGIAHFLEHMAFNGSENVPEGEMVKRLERYGLAFGPDTNASTGFERTTYMLDLPNVDGETLDIGFFLMRETADKLLLDQDAIDRERGVILSEERVRDTYSFRAYKAFAAFAFPDALHPKRLPIGTVDVIENGDRDLFADLYDRYYRPENAIFVVAGDIDPADIDARIRATFGDWVGRGEAGGEPDVGSVDPERGLAAGVFIHPDIPTRVTALWARPAEIKPDNAQTRAERLPLNIAIGALNRRLTRLARAADAPFLGASVSWSQSFDAFDQDSLAITTEPGEWAGGLAVAEQELRRALEYGFTDAEIAEQVTNLREALRRRAEAEDTRDSGALVSRIVGANAQAQVVTAPSADLERVTPLLDAMTKEAAHAALKERWGAGEPVLFMTTNVEGEGYEAALKDAWIASRNAPVEPIVVNDAGVFAYTDFGAPGEVVSRELIEDLGLTTVEFANNVRLNIKPTDFVDNVALISIGVGAGSLELPADQIGLGTFISANFIRGGLEAHSQDDLQTLFAGSSVDLSFSAGWDSYGFGGTVEPDDLLKQFQIYAGYMTAPGFRAEADAWWARVLPTWYETLDATPQAVAANVVPKLIASGDERFGTPPLETLQARTSEEAKVALIRSLTEGAIEIGVVGDVEPDAVIEAVAATFGALPERAYSASDLPDWPGVTFPTPASEEPVVIGHAGEPNRALALTYWPLVDDADRTLIRTLTLARAVLDLKLTDEAREAEALTYSPGVSTSFSDADVFPGYGWLSVSTDVTPERVEDAFALVDRLAARMVAGEVSDDELLRARKPILEGIEESLERNGYWLGVIGAAQTNPDSLERHRTRAADYGAITREEVIEAAKTYLAPNAAYRIAVLPSEDDSTN